MKDISRVHYKNKYKKDINFEITKISSFLENRPTELIETDFRLNFWLMMYITEGCGVHYINFKKYNYKKGDLILINKNQVHSFRSNKTVRGYMVNINEPFFFEGDNKYDFRTLSFFEVPYENPILSLDISEDTTSRKIIELIYKEYMEIEETFDMNLIKSLFLSFVYSIRKENRNNINEINEANYKNYYRFKNLVEANFLKFKTVKSYETIMNLSKKTINIACQKSVGLSAKSVISDRIILEIKRLLAQNELLNYEISYKLGFDEPSNLAGFFKRNVGISMNEFRKQINDK